MPLILKAGLAGGLFLWAVSAMNAQPARVPDRKAIVIGINCYKPDDPARPECASPKGGAPDTSAERFGTPSGGAWTYWSYSNLNGAVNDAKMMKSILESQGFTVPPDAFLTDDKATASAILNTLRKYLIDDTRNAQPGDVRFVYYSGHGNYVRNLAVADENDPDRYDETIVPSDHWRNTPDIRDKELSRIFSEASKKVKIIFVADSCHSGSLSRGPGGMSKTATSGSVDAPEAPKITDKAPADSSRARTVSSPLSAARRDQVALETPGDDVDNSDVEKGPHGAFTWALRKAWLGQPDAPLDRLFQKASALLALDKPNQAPNIDGLNTNSVNLFGQPVGPSAARVAVAQDVNGDDVRLRGGRAAGIYKGTELKRVASKSPAVEIQVTDEEGLDFSRAHVTEHGPGDYKLQKGDSFEVDKLVMPSESMISIYIPPAISSEALSRAVTEFGALPGLLGPRWVADEVAVTATHILRWNGKSWLLEKGDFEEGGTDLGAAPAAAAIAKRLPSDAKLFVALPPSQELADALPFGKGDQGRVTIAKTSAGANYRLRGRVHDGAAEYSWIQPAVNTAPVKAAANENLLELPLGTDWVSVSGDSLRESARSLGEKAYRLGRLREWQSLIAFGSSSNPFPYRLEFRDTATGKAIDGSHVSGGKKYKMYFETTPLALRVAGRVVPRYTYIFAIDQYGKGTLIWPLLGQGNQDNLFPAPPEESDAKATPQPTEIAVSGKADYDFEVGEPYGNDTYLVLTSVQRIDNPDIFDFEGVRSKAPQTRGAVSNPLE